MPVGSPPTATSKCSKPAVGRSWDRGSAHHLPRSGGLSLFWRAWGAAGCWICDAIHPAVECGEDRVEPRFRMGGAGTSRWRRDCFCKATVPVDCSDEESDEPHMGANKGEWRQLLHVCETANGARALQRMLESDLALLGASIIKGALVRAVVARAFQPVVVAGCHSSRGAPIEPGANRQTLTPRPHGGRYLPMAAILRSP